MRLCTEELVMLEVAMEYHGNRFGTGDHLTVSLVPLKETLFNPTQMQLPDVATGVHTESPIPGMMTIGAKGDGTGKR